MARTTTHMWGQGRLEDMLAVQLLDGHIVLATPNAIHKGELNHAAEDEYGAAQKPNLRDLDIADLWQSFSCGQTVIIDEGSLRGVI